MNFYKKTHNFVGLFVCNCNMAVRLGFGRSSGRDPPLFAFEMRFMHFFRSDSHPSLIKKNVIKNLLASEEILDVIHGGE